MSFVVEAARIHWQEGVPLSAQFGDIYFSRAAGLQESREVFLGGNRLPQRWQGRERFAIAETGFGTGLNFLVTVESWLQHAPSSARLHYISFEKFPLESEDLQRAYDLWPTLEAYSRPLLHAFPPLVAGFHRRALYGGRVMLTLILGDIEGTLPELQAAVDAWYLDGFAPAKNPGMWSPRVFREIARLSASAATFSTFTAAGHVRRGLQEVGFAVEKVAGFGGKRERLQGELTTPPAEVQRPPWFASPMSVGAPSRNALIIGAGIAGLATAHALVRRGWQVTIVDQRAQIADGASGNPAAILMPLLSADINRQSRVYTSAFLYTIHWLAELKTRQPQLEWVAAGLVHCLDEARIAKLRETTIPSVLARLIDATQATAHCGWPLTRHAFYYPQAGWLNPPTLFAALCSDMADGVSLRLGTTVADLKHDGATWRAVDERGSEIARAPVVVLACATAARAFGSAQVWSLRCVRGQVTVVRPDEHAVPPLRCPVSGDGYAIPMGDGRLCVGATFHPDCDDEAVCADDHAANLAVVGQLAGNASPAAFSILSGRAGVRAVTSDYRPMVGPLADETVFRQNYAGLHHGKTYRHYPRAVYQAGLYASVGHGSRGFVSAPWAAEILAGYLEHEPLCAPLSLLHALHPARFLIKALRQRVA